MNNNHGFSLTEVMVSLLLMTSTSLALLKQQWQTSQLLNQTQLRSCAFTQFDNTSERMLAGYSDKTMDKRFQVHIAKNIHTIMVRLQIYTDGVLQRKLVIL